ncbi:MFS transporter, AAHS family, 4-hydroxybenzoate transporter [Faunimonas pinastri]|uniref:MFS transporter, AAHS family, 4-hydroxybenzoate transporter n=1 Tax=Faunimonas pinastri TaxID=1855383 RepID=A0A1H9K7Q1_9HYPH|nr:MFS transporter, AAHS family, 4-hydroxybenzoate transporter [Faunimonas pinastri]
MDVGHVLDTGSWSGFQKTVLLFSALTVVFDGFDNQVLGFALPAIIKEWGVARSDFAPILAIGLVGMTIGTAVAGMLGDRIGRRNALIASVFLFGVMTAAISTVHGLTGLGILRFFAAMGLGGAIPNATTLAAEYTPLRRRPWAVTLTMVCVPLGGMVGGMVASRILPGIGWRALFAVGGLVPVILGVVLIFALPESPRYLARHPRRYPELARILSRFGKSYSADSDFVDRTEQHMARTPISALFGAGHLRDTVGLWGAFFSCLISVYMVFSWLPTMLSSEGLDLATAGSGLTAYNFGGVLGALGGAWLISYMGSRPAMLIMAAGGAVSALVLRYIPIVPEGSHFVLILMLGVHGAFVNAAQTTMYALVAHVYPTDVRATGAGAATAVGRAGSVLSSFVGAWVLNLGGGHAYFIFITVMMVLTFVALAIVHRHIPKLTGVGAVDPGQDMTAH